MSDDEPVRSEGFTFRVPRDHPDRENRIARLIEEFHPGWSVSVLPDGTWRGYHSATGKHCGARSAEELIQAIEAAGNGDS